MISKWQYLLAKYSFAHSVASSRFDSKGIGLSRAHCIRVCLGNWLICFKMRPKNIWHPYSKKLLDIFCDAFVTLASSQTRHCAWLVQGTSQNVTNNIERFFLTPFEFHAILKDEWFWFIEIGQTKSDCCDFIWACSRLAAWEGSGNIFWSKWTTHPHYSVSCITTLVETVISLCDIWKRFVTAAFALFIRVEHGFTICPELAFFAVPGMMLMHWAVFSFLSRFWTGDTFRFGWFDKYKCHLIPHWSVYPRNIEGPSWTLLTMQMSSPGIWKTWKWWGRLS